MLTMDKIKDIRFRYFMKGKKISWVKYRLISGLPFFMKTADEYIEERFAEDLKHCHPKVLADLSFTYPINSALP